MTAPRPDPLPTPEEHAFLLWCAQVWDQVAAEWRGAHLSPASHPLTTRYGLCWTLLMRTAADGQLRAVGRVPSLHDQVRRSLPHLRRDGFCWRPDACHAERAAHARKLAARCRALAAQ